MVVLPWGFADITHRTKMFTRSAVAAPCQPPPTARDGRRSISERRDTAVFDQAAGNGADIRQMSDPDFLTERARVRDMITALQQRMTELDEEFLKRAGAAWAEAVK